MDNIGFATTGELVTEQAPTTQAADTTPSTATIPNLPDGYLSDGYVATTEKGQSYLRPELVADHAMDIAAKLSTAMKPSDFAALHRGLKSAKKRTLPFEARQTAVCELLPKSLALVKHNKAPALLIDFIKANLNAIHTDEDWTGFYRHFEAVNNYIAAGGDLQCPHQTQEI